MATCGYYSSAKREVCMMQFGHKKRHFKYEEPPAKFSVKQHKAAEPKPPKPQFCVSLPPRRGIARLLSSNKG